REGHTSHLARMPSQDGDLLATLKIPDARRVIRGRRCDPTTVCAENRAQHRRAVALQKQDLLAFLKSHIRSPSRDAVITRFPSGLNTALLTERVWPFRTAISSPLSAFQMRAVWSSDPVRTCFPSRLKVALQIGPAWPLRLTSSSP